jgi:ppGpp synthetase/RelA/SpoT-type nucleotidyltranferase
VDHMQLRALLDLLWACLEHTAEGLRRSRTPSHASQTIQQKARVAYAHAELSYQLEKMQNLATPAISTARQRVVEVK